jgi:glycosyltransferase involved in cell wall biosynthesis
MRILFANKFGYLSGGVERVLYDEMAWLESAGHETALFATDSKRNDPSAWSCYYPPLEDLTSPGARSFGGKLRVAANLVRNREAARLFRAMIEEFRPDVVHAHAVHRQLSPSVLLAARDCGVPVVETVHDYHHVCPADRLVRGDDGALCDPQLCRRGRYFSAITHRCMRGERATSAVAAFELYAQHLTRAYERSVSAYVCPSAFMLGRMEAHGVRVPCVRVPNAVKPGKVSAEREDYAVFAGRLSAEKGLEWLLEAARRAGVRLVVVGDGPGAEAVRSAADVEWRGWLGEEELRECVAHARVAVVPSLWFENAPLAVLEPMSMGVPVIATALGGIPELVSDGETGLLVPPGDVDSLAAALSRAKDEPELMASLGERAREETLRRFSPDTHVASLERLYADVLAGRAPVGGGA